MARDRFVEVLEAHRPYGLDCKCGTPINSDQGWAAHVAVAVEAALGIHEEFRYAEDGYAGMTVSADGSSKRVGRPATRSTRLVSRWIKDAAAVAGTDQEAGK